PRGGYASWPSNRSPELPRPQAPPTAGRSGGYRARRGIAAILRRAVDQSTRERLDHFGIELRARSAAQFGHRGRGGARAPVSTIARDRREGVTYGDDPRTQRDRRAGHSVGV